MVIPILMHFCTSLFSIYSFVLFPVGALQALWQTMLLDKINGLKIFQQYIADIQLSN